MAGPIRHGADSSTQVPEDDGMSEEQSVAMTEHEVAHRLGISAATLRAWRMKRKGPRYVRFGRAVRYLRSDIDRFVEASLVEDKPRSTDEPVQ
jgi:excisionase family DNA binding protein